MLLKTSLLQVIKLSDGVQRLPRQVTKNVHGAARSFLEVGEQSAQIAKSEARSAWCMPGAHCLERELLMPTCSRPLLQGLSAAGADTIVPSCCRWQAAVHEGGICSGQDCVGQR